MRLVRLRLNSLAAIWDLKLTRTSAQIGGRVERDQGGTSNADRGREDRRECGMKGRKRRGMDRKSERIYAQTKKSYGHAEQVTTSENYLTVVCHCCYSNRRCHRPMQWRIQWLPGRATPRLVFRIMASVVQSKSKNVTTVRLTFATVMPKNVGGWRSDAVHPY